MRYYKDDDEDEDGGDANVVGGEDGGDGGADGGDDGGGDGGDDEDEDGGDGGADGGDDGGGEDCDNGGDKGGDDGVRTGYLHFPLQIYSLTLSSCSVPWEADLIDCSASLLVLWLSVGFTQ